MRSLVDKPSFFTTLRPARQLWQPVSATALTKHWVGGTLKMFVVLLLDAHLNSDVWLRLGPSFLPFLHGLVKDMVTQSGALGAIQWRVQVGAKGA